MRKDVGAKKKALKDKLDRVGRTGKIEDFPFDDLQKDIPEINKEESLERIRQRLR